MIIRIYHPYQKWEDFNFGMFEKTCFMDDHQMINDCKNLLACTEWLWEAMQFVAHNWKYSTEQNLSNLRRNRQAWLGQAACCFVHGAPEYTTKAAYNLLTERQQISANKVADEVISLWEERFFRDEKNLLV